MSFAAAFVTVTGAGGASCGALSREQAASATAHATAISGRAKTRNGMRIGSLVEKHGILTDLLLQRARATGKRTVKKRHDEWLKRCSAESGNRDCPHPPLSRARERGIPALSSDETGGR